MSITAPIRLIVITDTPMPLDWEEQRQVITPIIQSLWHEELLIDPLLRSVVNATFPFEYMERYVSFYMEDQACDVHPVYVVYIPKGHNVNRTITCLRKEFFVRLWPNGTLRTPHSPTEEVSAFIFALSKNFGGRVMNLTYTEDFIAYKVTSETMTFRNYFFQQARKCIRSVK